jgi:MFS family permease
MSAYTIGAIFFGWGVLLALFSVVVAPRLQLRFSSLQLAAACLISLTTCLIAIAFGSAPVIIAAVVLSGAVMGLNNTVYTEMALEVSDAPRSVASAGYNFVRWFAGVIAPYAAPEIAERFNPTLSFVLAAFAALLAAAILFALRRRLGRFGATRHVAALVNAPVPHLTEG